MLFFIEWQNGIRAKINWFKEDSKIFFNISKMSFKLNLEAIKYYRRASAPNTGICWEIQEDMKNSGVVYNVLNTLALRFNYVYSLVLMHSGINNEYIPRASALGYIQNYTR